MKTILAACSLLLAPCSLFAQGPLTPPGAPGPLFKTLQQVEPRTPISSIPITLTNSGSYYLTTNLTQTNNAAGITVAANDITIDLNGFALIGTNGIVDGITRGGAIRTNCRVRNGTVRNWAVGVNMNGGGFARLEQLLVSGNSSHGIQLNDSAIVVDCSVSQNVGVGILATSAETVIRDCMVLENGLDGIRVSSAALVVGNFCNGKGTTGPTNAGIRAMSNRNRIENNHVSFYQNGVVVLGSGNFIFRNTASNVGTNYTFAGGNSFGPTNVVSGVATNHPWANFSQ